MNVYIIHGCRGEMEEAREWIVRGYINRQAAIDQIDGMNQKIKEVYAGKYGRMNDIRYHPQEFGRMLREAAKYVGDLNLVNWLDPYNMPSYYIETVDVVDLGWPES